MYIKDSHWHYLLKMFNINFILKANEIFFCEIWEYIFSCIFMMSHLFP